MNSIQMESISTPRALAILKGGSCQVIVKKYIPKPGRRQRVQKFTVNNFRELKQIAGSSDIKAMRDLKFAIDSNSWNAGDATGK